MSEKELRELDAELGKLFGLCQYTPFAASGGGFICAHCGCRYSSEKHRPFNPTTDRAAVMEVLEKCAEKANEIEPSAFVSVGVFHQVFQVIMIYHNGVTTEYSHESQAPTLPLAIALFAQKLFKKDSEKGK